MSLATISSCETWRDYVKLDNAYAIGYGRQVLPEDLPGACFVMAPLVAYLRVSHSARSLEAVHKQLQTLGERLRIPALADMIAYAYNAVVPVHARSEAPPAEAVLSVALALKYRASYRLYDAYYITRQLSMTESDDLLAHARTVAQQQCSDAEISLGSEVRALWEAMRAWREDLAQRLGRDALTRSQTAAAGSTTAITSVRALATADSVARDAPPLATPRDGSGVGRGNLLVAKPRSSGVRRVLTSSSGRVLRAQTPISAAQAISHKGTAGAAAALAAHQSHGPVCRICLEDQTSAIETLADCRHAFCPQCIRGYVASVIDGESPQVLVCPLPECKRPMVEADLGRFLDSVSRTRYELRLVESAMSKDGVLGRCSAPNCDYIVFWDGKSSDSTRLACPKCKATTCVRCRVSPHHHGTCEAYRAAVEEAELLAGVGATKAETERKLGFVLTRGMLEGYKPCPGCHHLVERAFGCPNMQCRCGFRWCYTCGHSSDDCDCIRREAAEEENSAPRTRVTFDAALAAQDHIRGQKPVIAWRETIEGGTARAQESKAPARVPTPQRPAAPPVRALEQGLGAGPPHQRDPYELAMRRTDAILRGMIEARGDTVTLPAAAAAAGAFAVSASYVSPQDTSRPIPGYSGYSGRRGRDEIPEPPNRVRRDPSLYTNRVRPVALGDLSVLHR